MTRLIIDHLTLWISAAASEHSHDLADHLEERTGASRRAAQAALRRLVDAGWLTRSGSPRQPVYGPGALRQVARSYTLFGLQEDIPWQRDFAPHFDLPPHVARMIQHGFTELVNNAAATVVLGADSRNVQLTMVAGKPLKWEGELIGCDLEALRELVRGFLAEELTHRRIIRPEPLPHALQRERESELLELGVDRHVRGKLLHDAR